MLCNRSAVWFHRGAKQQQVVRQCSVWALQSVAPLSALLLSGRPSPTTTRTYATVWFSPVKRRALQVSC
ncbi:unnamed protein product [Arctia plantaginis]|uniref:Uncharacterized protein n=1 Tax=Arctia plantaginis TaxID=874455 RepID=A0A8S1A2R1_ARCPL|nr:unnamed protein product [Arctia plantaginis]